MNEITDTFGHEIVGLPVRIISSRDPTLIDVQGEIILETMKTIRIESKSKILIIPKVIGKFEFTKEGETMLIDGAGLLGRPDERIAKVK
ncbi:MAG: ribonuclease P protein component 1 [Nitrososphaerales archaeon]